MPAEGEITAEVGPVTWRKESGYGTGTFISRDGAQSRSWSYVDYKKIAFCHQPS